MCGIYGVVTNNSNVPSIKESTDSLTHRGPDSSGFYEDEHVGLGHRRLSIIDVEGSKQPCLNEAKDVIIIFNGEIYNYIDLRNDLISKGYKFDTHGDTETILHAYEEWGDDCVSRLRGMFSFAIWDKRKKKLFLARDRLGIKPLFYCEHEGVLYFSSEIKAILKNSMIPRDINERALVDYFTYSYIPAPRTIYTKISKLLPGHTLTWIDGVVTIKKYWDLVFSPQYNKSESEYIEQFMEIFRESVEGHMISDVPIGAFLSGGVDSSAVVALMSKSTNTPINTLCMGFGGNTGGYLDERKYAQMVANQYSTHHQEYEIQPQLDGILDKIVDAFDEPFADDSSIPSYYVCEKASQNVKVALSGLGGDELFAGYERYLGFKLQSIYGRLPQFLRNTMKGMVDYVPERKDGHYTINHIKRFVRGGNLSPDKCYSSYISLLTPDIRSSLFTNSGCKEHFQSSEDEFSSYFNSKNIEGRKDSLDRATYTDIKVYLPDDILALTDRLSMQHSLEVRVPFLDHKLMEYCATIPPEIRLKGLKKKYLLKKAVRNIIPAEVIDHRKQGFVGPTASWIKTDLKETILKLLSVENLNKHGFLNVNTVNNILHEHFSGKQLHDKLIWSMVIFQKWYEKNIH